MFVVSTEIRNDRGCDETHWCLYEPLLYGINAESSNRLHEKNLTVHS